MKKTLASMALSTSEVHRAAKMLTAPQLKRLISNLNRALEKKESEHRAKKLKEVAQVINEIGASEAELRDLIESPKKTAKAKQVGPKRTKSRGVKKGTKIPKKYQLREGNKVHKWTGRGRMPLVFKNYIESGGCLSECLIKT